MDSTDLLKRVRKIEIKSRGLSNQIFSGEYHSAFKGSGMAFSEVREYMPGDEIRKIDWNVTARFGKPFIKVFEEEREMTVMLLVDISGSEDFGSKTFLKREVATELSAVLAFSAIQNNDKIGVILFSDHVEKFISPKKGKSHILRIIRELISFEPKSEKTKVSEALRFLTNAIKKKSTVFVISDFFDDGFTDALKIANNKHDVVALELFDKRENDMSNIGLVPFEDAETHEVRWVDTSDPQTRTAFKAAALKREHELKSIFRKSGVDHAQIDVEHTYVRPLMNLFKQRERRR